MADNEQEQDKAFEKNEGIVAQDRIDALKDFLNEDDVDQIVAEYEKFGTDLSRSTYYGSAIVRTPENAPFVMEREVPWDELPADVKRAWARAGLSAGNIVMEHHTRLIDMIRNAKRKQAAELGELPGVPKRITNGEDDQPEPPIIEEQQ